jgi:hypothetical protein
VSDELVRIRKEAAMPYLKILSQLFLGVRKTIRMGLSHNGQLLSQECTEFEAGTLNA